MELEESFETIVIRGRSRHDTWLLRLILLFFEARGRERYFLATTGSARERTEITIIGRGAILRKRAFLYFNFSTNLCGSFRRQKIETRFSRGSIEASKYVLT